MIGVDRKRPLQRQLITISPFKRPSFPVQISAVSIRNQKIALHRKIKRRNGHESIVRGFVRSSYISISGLENQRSLLRIVKIERRYLLQLHERFEVHLQAWSQGRLDRCPLVPVPLRLKVHASLGIHLEIYVNLRKELWCLSSGKGAHAQHHSRNLQQASRKIRTCRPETSPPAQEPEKKTPSRGGSGYEVAWIVIFCICH